MPPLTAPADELTALAEGRAAVDLSGHRKIRVFGGDARRWLHDLVTTDVASLAPARARRSLLLDPAGHIRADLHVACDVDGFWLFQAPDQSDHVGSALAPYVLSSDVRLEDRSDDRAMLALPGPSEDGLGGFRPSVLGSGRDVLADPGRGPDVPRGRLLVGVDAVDVWRVRRGVPRMGADFDATSIPAESGLETTIDTAKGCFLGQESVARVRNLGHPPRVLLHLSADGPVDAGTPVLRGGEAVGVVTSAAERGDGGTVVLASIRWEARDAPLTSPERSPLTPVGSLD